jgi:hypothetical protein
MTRLEQKSGTISVAEKQAEIANRKPEKITEACQANLRKNNTRIAHFSDLIIGASTCGRQLLRIENSAANDCY